MNVIEQLPVIPVIALLVAAPVTILLPNGATGRTPYLWATLVSWAAFAACVKLLATVAETGPVSYSIGDWAPPIGIEYRIDLANALVLTLVSGIAALVAPFSLPSVRSEIDLRQINLFYSAFLICLLGLLGVTITGDAFNVFVFLEISSLSTYALIALGARTDRRALTASFNYLIMGTIGATFFVIGLGLLYQATGTLNMADIKIKAADAAGIGMIEAGLAFIIVGIGLKAAMFPMHLWMPNAYAYAPSAVTAFIAAASTKVAVYVIIRFVYSVIGSEFAFVQAALTYILMPLGIAGMFFASLVAFFQADVKRMLAYSSIGQIGYMLLGIGLATKAGLAASLVHLFNHGLMKGALFMAVACVALRVGGRSVDAFRGLARRMPFTASAFIFSGLSLVGVPLTVGFISKWTLVTASFGADKPWAAFLIVASSLIAVAYVGRLIEIILLREAPTTGPFAGPVREAPLSMLIPLWTLVAANVYFGLDTDLTVNLATRAAEALVSVSGLPR